MNYSSALRKYRNFTQFPGVEILQKDPIFKKLGEIFIFYAVLRRKLNQIWLALDFDKTPNIKAQQYKKIS